jgi:WD40 repeat protein
MLDVQATLAAESNDIHGDGNHPQGCAFSPDGLCVLTATVGDSRLRLYNTVPTPHHVTGETPQEEVQSDNSIEKWTTALTCKAGDAVRSYDWYPRMQSSDPSTCCFIATSRYVMTTDVYPRTILGFSRPPILNIYIYINLYIYCLFLLARDQPIHLYDAYDGTVRASYRPYNGLDELEAPTVATFSIDGQRIGAAGFRTDRTIHVFDTARPGRDSLTVLRLGKTRRSSDGQKGLVSALTSSPDSRIFAVGTYSPGSIYVYDERTGQLPTGTILSGICVVGHGRSHSKRKRRFEPPVEGSDAEGDNNDQLGWLSSAKVKWFLTRAQGGITQMRFAPNQQYTLFSSSRRSDAILAWDLRMLSGNPDCQSHPVRGFASFETRNATNQRLEFDLDRQTLFVGGCDKCVRIYNTETNKRIGFIKDLDVCNGISYTMLGQTGLLAIATGARRFPEEDNDGDSFDLCRPPGFIRLFKLTGLG